MHRHPCREDGELVDAHCSRSKLDLLARTWDEFKGLQRVMYYLADLIDKHAEELATLETIDMGAPVRQLQVTRGGRVGYAVLGAAAKDAMPEPSGTRLHYRPEALDALFGDSR